MRKKTLLICGVLGHIGSHEYNHDWLGQLSYEQKKE